MKRKPCMLLGSSRTALLANCFLAILTPAVLTAQELPLPVPEVGSNASVKTGPLEILNWAGFDGAVSFTFDDSQPSQIQHFSELRATGVPVTFYISTGNRGLANFDATWSAAASAGDEIGNHTVAHCHANLTGCSFGASTGSLASELDQATSFITQRYPQSAVWTGASPFGDTGYDGSAASRFFLYRGVGSGSIGPNDATDPFNLPCHLAASGETQASFNAATDAARTGGRWQIFLIHTITPTPDIWFNPVAIADVTGAMSHAKSLGNVWVDTVANIGAYWRGQKILASTTPVTVGGTTTWNWQLPAHFPGGKMLRVMIANGSLSQNGVPLAKSPQGFYTVALDAGSLTLTTDGGGTGGGGSPSFGLMPSSSSVSVTQGMNASDTISVVGTGGFTGAVTLQASGLPNGVTASFAANPTTGTSTVLFAASSFAAAGPSVITITGTSGGMTKVTTIALTVNSSGSGSGGGGCTVDYTISSQSTNQFTANIAIKNGGSSTLSGWSLTWIFADGQTIASSWNGAVSQSGGTVTVSQQSGQTWENIPPGGTYTGFGFNGTWNSLTNAIPTSFKLNGTACTVN